MKNMVKYLLSLLLPACLGAGYHATAKELLRNGQFDEGSAYWYSMCTGLETYGNETRYGGTVATNRVGEIDDYSCFYQDVCVLAGLDYIFNMKASRRTGNGAAANPVTTTLRIEGLDAANTVVATYVHMDFSRTNTSFALTPVTGIPAISVPLGSGVVRLRVSFRDTTPGAPTGLGMIIDDISLVLKDTMMITGRDTVCQYAQYPFSVTNVPPSGVYYHWDFDTGGVPQTSALDRPQASWQTPGRKRVICELSNGVCVFDTLLLDIVVFPGNTSYRSLTICSGTSVTLSSSTADPVQWQVMPGGAPLSSLSCATCNRPVATPDRSTVYYAVTVSSGVCPVTDTVSVSVDRDNTLSTDPEGELVLCHPGFVRPQGVVTGPGPLQNVFCGHVASLPLTPADTVRVDPYLASVNKTPSGAPGTPFPPDRLSARHQYVVRASDLRASGMYAGTLDGMALLFPAGSGNSVVRNIRIALQCVSIPGFEPSSIFASGSTEVFFSDSVSIPPQGGYVWFPFSEYYNRDSSQNLLIDICYQNDAGDPLVAAVCARTPYYATLYDTTSGACAGPPGVPAVAMELPVCLFSYRLAPEAPWHLQWGSDNGILSAGAVPEFYIEEPGKIHVTTYNRNGCRLTDTLDIYMPDTRLLPADTMLCKGESIQLQTQNGESWQWYEHDYRHPATLSCGTCADPVATPAEHVTYTVVITDHGCADTFRVGFNVTPYPELNITPSDTTINYSQYAQLRVTGADSYLWTPGYSLDHPYGDSPVATPGETTVYTVTGYPEANRRCSSNASATVRINYRVPLMMPTAFTPDGNGLNDRFRITNFSFQKVVEFRVFNRWGKEIYAATDNTGWDGTWEGAPQATDVYHYLVRIAIPDGTIETFKGDVTLIR